MLGRRRLEDAPVAKSPLRVLCKTFSWRLVATIATGLIVWLFTGKLALAATVGGLEAIAKLVLYYGHELLWERVDTWWLERARAPHPPESAQTIKRTSLECPR